MIDSFERASRLPGNSVYSLVLGMHPYLIPLANQFRLHANPETAAGAKAYMRNQFEFYGLYTKDRRMITKAHIKTSLPGYDELESIVKECWALPQREYQYFAIELAAAMKKQWKPGIIGLFEFIITHKSWWDTVDHAESHLTGPYFRMFPGKIRSITGKWNRSGNTWLQRASIMFKKSFKKDTDTRLFSAYLLAHAGSKEFFIRKAIGWALREYSKTDPEWVKRFVGQNKLSPLSAREALKNCPD